MDQVANAYTIPGVRSLPANSIIKGQRVSVNGYQDYVLPFRVWPPEVNRPKLVVESLPAELYCWQEKMSGLALGQLSSIRPVGAVGDDVSPKRKKKQPYFMVNHVSGGGIFVTKTSGTVATILGAAGIGHPAFRPSVIGNPGHLHTLDSPIILCNHVIVARDRRALGAKIAEGSDMLKLLNMKFPAYHYRQHNSLLCDVKIDDWRIKISQVYMYDPEHERVHAIAVDELGSLRTRQDGKATIVSPVAPVVLKSHAAIHGSVYFWKYDDTAYVNSYTHEPPFDYLDKVTSTPGKLTRANTAPDKFCVGIAWNVCYVGKTEKSKYNPFKNAVPTERVLSRSYKGVGVTTYDKKSLRPHQYGDSVSDTETDDARYWPVFSEGYPDSDIYTAVYDCVETLIDKLVLTGAMKRPVSYTNWLEACLTSNWLSSLAPVSE